MPIVFPFLNRNRWYLIRPNSGWPKVELHKKDLFLNNLRVTISRGQVTVLRRLFLFPVYYKKIVGRAIKELSLKRTGSTGQGTRKTEHYKIVAHLQSGGKITLAEGINGEDLADQFKNYLQQRIQTGY